MNKKNTLLRTNNEYKKNCHWFIEWEKKYAREKALHAFSSEVDLFLAKNLIRARKLIFLQTFAKKSGLPLHFMKRCIECDAIPCVIFPSRTTELVKNTYRLFVDIDKFKITSHYNDFVEVINYFGGKQKRLIKPSKFNTNLHVKKISSPCAPHLAKNLSPYVTVNIPISLWAGKTPEAVFIALYELDYAPAVIAFIIMEKVGGITKTNAGRLFYKKEIAKGIIQEDRTYQRKIDTLLSEAKAKFLFTFNE